MQEILSAMLNIPHHRCHVFAMSFTMSLSVYIKQQYPANAQLVSEQHNKWEL